MSQPQPTSAVEGGEGEERKQDLDPEVEAHDTRR